mmetsp:Transcript_511/g.654  ORF Transcript_511/g.654 Transcript_511/m.654 type:complete len:257 (-) Transcript_511:221-991(-)
MSHGQCLGLGIRLTLWFLSLFVARWIIFPVEFGECSFSFLFHETINLCTVWTYLHLVVVVAWEPFSETEPFQVFKGDIVPDLASSMSAQHQLYQWQLLACLDDRPVGHLFHCFLHIFTFFLVFARYEEFRVPIGGGMFEQFASERRRHGLRSLWTLDDLNIGRDVIITEVSRTASQLSGPEGFGSCLGRGLFLQHHITVLDSICRHLLAWVGGLIQNLLNLFFIWRLLSSSPSSSPCTRMSSTQVVFGLLRFHSHS